MKHFKFISNHYETEAPRLSISSRKESQEWQSKKMIEFLDELLESLQLKRGFKEFAFFVTNNSSVQQKLKKSLEKSSFMERLVQVGKESSYKFIEKDVKEVFGVLCSSSSMEELLSKLVDWGKGGLHQFLTDVRNEPDLKKELDKIGDRNNFVTFLKDTFNQPDRKKKYQWLTEQDIEEAANLIPPEEKKPEPEKPAVPKIVGRIWC